MKRVVGIECGSRKDGVIQSARTVITAKVETERVLSFGRVRIAIVIKPSDVIAASHPNSRVELKAAIVLRTDQLHRDWSFPFRAVLGGVARTVLHNASASVKIIGRGH